MLKESARQRHVTDMMFGCVLDYEALLGGSHPQPGQPEQAACTRSMEHVNGWLDGAGATSILDGIFGCRGIHDGHDQETATACFLALVGFLSSQVRLFVAHLNHVLDECFVAVDVFLAVATRYARVNKSRR